MEMVTTLKLLLNVGLYVPNMPNLHVCIGKL